MSPHSRRKAEKILRQVIVYLPLVIICLLILFPFYWMITSSFGDPHAVKVNLTPDIRAFTLENYRWVLLRLQFPRWFLNSMLVAATTTVLGVMFSMFAAYALARMRFWGRSGFAMTIVLTQLLPTILLAIPWYVMLSRLHLVNSYPSLIVTYLTLVLPFSIWMLFGYFQGIPVELEEAAMIDGCSRSGALIRIVLPLSAPGLATVALFAFVMAWEEFLYALLIMSSDDMITLTVGASRLISDQVLYFGYLGAYGVLTVLPVALIFAFLQRYLVQGLTAGAVK